MSKRKRSTNTTQPPGLWLEEGRLRATQPIWERTLKKVDWSRALFPELWDLVMYEVLTSKSCGHPTRGTYCWFCFDAVIDLFSVCKLFCAAIRRTLQRRYQYHVRRARLAFDAINWHNPGFRPSVLPDCMQEWDTFADLLYSRVKWQRRFVLVSLCLPGDRSPMVTMADARYIFLDDHNNDKEGRVQCREAFNAWRQTPARYQTFLNLLVQLPYLSLPLYRFVRPCERLILRWCTYDVDDCLLHVLLCCRCSPTDNTTVMTKLWVRTALNAKLNIQWKFTCTCTSISASHLLLQYFTEGADFKILHPPSPDAWTRHYMEAILGWGDAEFDNIRPLVNTVRAILKTTNTT